MIFSRGIALSARRDMQRLREHCPADELDLLEDCWDVLQRFLRYDPHLQGEVGAASPLRVVTCGLLRVYFVVLSPDDRYVDIRGVGRNPNWVP